MHNGVARAPATPMGAGVDARVVSALLTGINRAFPYVDGDAVEPLVEKVSPALFAIAHSPNLGGALQALALLLQLLSARAAVSDRFYRALYATLLHPGAPRGSSAAAGQLLSLTFRSLKDDPRPQRAAAVVKRLLQVAQHAGAPFACGALMLVSEFLKQKPSHWDAVRQPREGDEDDDVERFVDADDDDEGFGDDSGDKKSKSEVVKKSGGGSDSDDGDDKETSDSDADGDDETSDAKKIAAQKAKTKESMRYDMTKRDPLYARADQVCWWELSLLERNVHPSVAAMARSLLGGFSVDYAGDPLADMTLASFLDKWLQKKPKRAKVSKGGSEVMMKKRDVDPGSLGFAPGTTEFAKLAENEVDPSEVFFHRYYAAKESDGKTKKKEKKGGAGEDDETAGDSDADSEDDDLVLEKRKKKAERAGIEGFDHEDDENDSDPDDPDLGEFENDDSDEDDDALPSAGGRKGTLKPSGIDPKTAGFGDYDSDEDAAADREERKEEDTADADAYNYDSLVDAYGEKPGYLRRQMDARAAEAAAAAESESDVCEEEEEEEEEDDDDEDGVKVWEYEGDGSEEEEEGAVDSEGEGDSEGEDVSEGEDDSEQEGASDDDDGAVDDAPGAVAVDDDEVTLTAAVPGKSRGGADAFASLDDYQSMIDADFADHPPAKDDDDDTEKDEEEDDETPKAKKTNKRKSVSKSPKSPSAKKKKPSPAVTRSRRN